MASSATRRAGRCSDGHGDKHSLRLANAHLRRILAEEFVARWQADAFQRGTDGTIAVYICAECVGSPGFFQLRADLKRRIQRRERALQYECDLASAKLAKFAFPKFQQVGAFKFDCAVDQNPLAIEQIPELPSPACFFRSHSVRSSPRTSPRRMFNCDFAQDGGLIAVAHGDPRR